MQNKESKFNPIKWAGGGILFLILGILFLIIAVGIFGFDSPGLAIVLSGAGFVLIVLATAIYLFRH
ncbi:MAG: hypothetical protein CVT89_05195 [Candidatus Altiarchaeales archaeon HGW-Altiarchaeales-2]|nr:MAG: hypothetical protein CVT89_05195 [Candidatus Altiarchaeales archaeon HGW-Altiarchaeales-2]